MLKIKKTWKKLGPGLITGAADDDPSGIATYSQVGAQFGYQFLWMTLFTFPFMLLIQEMCARIGIVTGCGLSDNIKKHYSRTILYVVVLLLFVANTFNIAANISAMAACIQLFLPKLNFMFLAILLASIIVCLEIFISYKTYSKYLKYLTLVLFTYVATAFFIPIAWQQVGYHFFIPTFTFTKEQILILFAIVGTTISPYLFFWQTSHEVEEKKLEKTKVCKKPTEKSISNMRLDVMIGMILSNIIMFFIIVVCASTLHAQGITNIQSATDAAQALKPFAGDWAMGLFALGIVGTSMLSIPILAGSSAYAVAETFNWSKGLNKKWYAAYKFYGVILISVLMALIINFIGISPMKGLVYAAILNGIASPIILYFIVNIGRNPKIMGVHVNQFIMTLAAWFVIVVMASIAVGSLFIFTKN